MSHLRRPIVAALLAFLAGLLASLRLAPSPVLVAAAFATLLLLPRLAARTTGDRPGRKWWLLGLFALSGAAVGSFSAAEAASDCRAALPDGRRVVATGYLGAPHREGAAGAGAPLLPLVRASTAGCPGEIRFRMPPGEADLPAGASVVVTGEWRVFPTDGLAAWPRDPRFLGFLSADSVELRDDPPPRAAGLSARAWADDRVARLFPRHRALVEALVLGRREYVDSAIEDRFSRAGLTHLLAISGMHVGLLAGALLLLANVARLPRAPAALLTIAAVWVYLIVIGAPSPALRSALMVSVALAATLLQRPTASLAGLAAAALVILALRPLDLLGPGFQLSFLGVLGLILLRPLLLDRLPGSFLRAGPRRWLADALAVNVAAFLATAPVVAHHFQVVAPVSILAGLPAVPLTSLALVGAAAALALDPLVPALAALIADGAAFALDLLDALAATAASLRFGHFPVPPPPWSMWAPAAAAALLVSRSGRFGGPVLRRTAAAGSALAIFLLWPLGSALAPRGLEVHFVDVGQGDAIALRTPAGRWVLVDAGPASDEYDAGERRVVPFLRQEGARGLEAMVLTHPDLDHIGGAAAVLRALPVRHLFEPGLAVGRDPYLQLLRTLESRRVDWRAARAGRSLEMDGVRFDFLWPDAETIDGPAEPNHISAVLRVTYGDFTLLLTGDAGVEVEEVLVRRYGAGLQADVLKLGHHGSATSTAAGFLDTVEPELAVVSAGRRNRYGHPAPAVVEAVEARAIPIARTDREGTISIEVEPGGASWRRERF